MEPVEKPSWFESLFQQEHFVNAIAILIVLTYLLMQIKGIQTSERFETMVMMVVAFYFSHHATNKAHAMQKQRGRRSTDSQQEVSNG
jgi:hypothetical protein